jgi:urease accessory protein
LALTSLPAAAHTGLEAGFSLVDGLLHPLSGFDHVAAMLCVGLWAALARGRAQWAFPPAFVAAMVFGGVLVGGGVAVPLAEAGIALSVIGLGLAVAAGAKVPTLVGVPLIAAFGICHGAAHGAEAPADGFSGYALGFTISTIALHGAGFGAARLIETLADDKPVRIAGAMAAASGLVLIAR